MGSNASLLTNATMPPTGYLISNNNQEKCNNRMLERIKSLRIFAKVCFDSAECFESLHNSILQI